MMMLELSTVTFTVFCRQSDTAFDSSRARTKKSFRPPVGQDIERSTR
jgi:hypothetical protein